VGPILGAESHAESLGYGMVKVVEKTDAVEIRRAVRRWMAEESMKWAANCALQSLNMTRDRGHTAARFGGEWQKNEAAAEPHPSGRREG